MLNRREASLETQTRCMRLAEISNKPRDVAASLRSIGDINTERDSIQAARTALDRALIIGRGLAASGTKDDQALMADVLGSLGSLELKDNRLQQALQAYKKAHDLYSQLAVGNPERYSYGVGSTLNNIGLVMRRENRVEEALEAYEKALAVERRVAQADNDRFRPEIARTLNNLGSLHLNHNQILVNDSRRRKAEAAYVEPLSIFERLAQVNPKTYMPEVAGLQNNLGLFYHSENHRAKALRSYCSGSTER